MILRIFFEPRELALGEVAVVLLEGADHFRLGKFAFEIGDNLFTADGGHGGKIG